jgi:hypothetical protein
LAPMEMEMTMAKMSSWTKFSGSGRGGSITTEVRRLAEGMVFLLAVGNNVKPPL